MIFENRTNVNDDKNEIHQTESVINVNRMIYRMNRLTGCTSRHPSRRHPKLSNVPLGGMHQSASVMMAYDIEEMSHLAGCTNRHPS